MTSAPEAISTLLKTCAEASPSHGLDGLVASLNAGMSDYHFRPVLTRSGWYRPGGVREADGRSLSENIAQWVEREIGDELEEFVARHQGSELIATRLQGRTHYLTADTGDAPEDFVQLEVEELQEVDDRVLLPDGWMPDDVDDLIDPLECEPLPPSPVGRPRFVFRRIQSVPALLLSAGDTLSGLKRFMYDWAASSAGKLGPFSHHWVLALRETESADGELRLSAKPISANPPPRTGLSDYAGQRGEDLLNDIRAYDQAAGYPFAWFFAMLTSRKVPFEVGEAVLADLAADYDYLPPRDALILSAWSNRRYAI